MKSLPRMLAAIIVAFATLATGPSFASKDVVFAVASTFTTTDPYDANDTLSQAMAKSFYEGLYGFDKDMKMIPVLAESYDVNKDGLVYTIKLKKGIKFHDGPTSRPTPSKPTSTASPIRKTSSSATACTVTSPRPRSSTITPHALR